MTHQELAKELSSRSGLSTSVSGALLTETFASISAALLAGQEVMLRDFGTFRMDGQTVRFVPSGPLASGHPDTQETEYTRLTDTRVIRPKAGRKDSDLSRQKGPEGDRKVSDAPRQKEPEAAPRGGGSPPAGAAAPKAKRPEVPPAGDSTRLTDFAQDVLGLNTDELKRGLGLDGRASPLASTGRRLTFPVQISRQAKDHSGRFWRPADGEERRSLKDLALKNFFVTLGSIVRDRQTHEPLIVFDVAEQRGPKGECYSIQLLRVKGHSAGGPGGAQAHELGYEELEFDPDRHEVLMVIDEKLGPRVHSFDIGTLLTNDRRDRAEICLAQEYENFRAERG